MSQALFAIPAEDSARLVPYLPSALALADAADGPTAALSEFKRMLLAQQLHPGQKVPLDTIASNLGLSRTPVREAMRLLETEGLVVSLPNRGFLVRRINAAETAHLFDARACIEGHVIAESMKAGSTGLANRLCELQQTYTHVLNGAPGRRRLGILADKAFHLCIAEAAANPFLTTTLAKIFDRLIFARPLEGFQLSRMDEAVAEHEEILAAIRAGDVDRARDTLLKNIKRGGSAIVGYLSEMETARIAI